MGVSEVQEMRGDFWEKEQHKATHTWLGRSVWLTTTHASIITVLPCEADVVLSFSLICSVVEHLLPTAQEVFGKVSSTNHTETLPALIAHDWGCCLAFPSQICPPPRNVPIPQIYDTVSIMGQGSRCGQQG